MAAQASTAAGAAGSGPEGMPEGMWTEPAPWIKFLRKNIWWIGGTLLVLMITSMRFFLVRRPPPPPIIGEVPAFTLVDHEGETFTRDDLLEEDKVWVVGFVFTSCPSTCPAVSRAMVLFQEQVAASKLEDHIELITVTVDPETDTPEVLKGYAEKIGADTRNWRFLTGDSDAIEGFVVDGFKLAVGDKQAIEGAPGVYDIAHSIKLALVDRFGNVRGYYSIDDEGMAELYHRSLRVMRIREEGE